MSTHASHSRGYTQRWNAGREAVDEARTKTADNTPIDHAHLARYTLGDRALELEILDLFLAEAPRTLRRLEELAATVPCDPKSWVAGCHTLKGSARAVGAHAVAAAAEQAEMQTDLTSEHLDGHVKAMLAALEDAAAYIAQWRQT